MQLTDNQRRYWRTNLRITAILLVIWFTVTFVVGYFAPSLNANFFGWPFYYWVGSQGSLLVYLLIIWYYARAMNRLDDEFAATEDREK